MSMLRARGLARTFRTKKTTVEAVRGVDLDVGDGEIVGFLGPNGAGKTTTLRMLTTLLPPTAGEATVAGCDLRRAPGAVRRRIGYVAQAGGVDPTLPVAEELTTQGEFHGMTAAAARGRAADLAGRFGLAELMGRPSMTLSGGQRRRLDLALGLVHHPRLLFLDEPSTGLDPAGRAGLWRHIRDVRDADGMTVFCTTHYLDEADALCDRVLIIDGGVIIAEGTPAELKRKLSGDAIVVDLPPGGARAATAALTGRAGAAAGVTSVTAEPGAGPGSAGGPVDGSEDGGGNGGGGERLRLAVADGDRALAAVVLALDAVGVRPTAVRAAEPTLDDVFLALTGRAA